jgi:predicted component of type VI protein secretion system
MRIILVQAEIELAIRDYVLNKIAVKERQKVTIDFKNTRGEDGATAEINISSPLDQAQTSSAARQEPTSTQLKEALRNTQAASAAPAVEATVDTTTQEEEAPAQPASTTSEPEGENQKEEALPDEATEEAAGETFEEDQGETEAVTKPVGEDAPAPPKSLFANLVKPVNAKT